MADPNTIFNPHSQLYFVDGDVVLTAKEPLPHEDARIQYFAFIMQFYASILLYSQVCSWPRHRPRSMRTPPGGDGGRRGPSGRVALDVDILSFVSLSLALIYSSMTLVDVDKRETRIERWKPGPGYAYRHRPHRSTRD